MGQEEWAELGDRKFHQKMRKNFLLRVAEHWNRRPRETVEISPGDAQKLSGHNPE